MGVLSQAVCRCTCLCVRLGGSLQTNPDARLRQPFTAVHYGVYICVCSCAGGVSSDGQDTSLCGTQLRALSRKELRRA